ncbi:tRNA-dependent cyclodipeptide synthase [Streptomyces spororaveus]|uniref:tRNA-dependent cyclodipeptide synthase n=1 Tax=Streptomyces spororaveus TaxID=284039 RepID=UPI0037A4BE0C
MTITADASCGVLPFIRTCRHVREDGDHAPIGVSPGNGHFSAERITGPAHARRTGPRRSTSRAEESGPRAGIHVRVLSEFRPNPVRQPLDRRVPHFLESGEEFRKGCEETARNFV